MKREDMGELSEDESALVPEVADTYLDLLRAKHEHAVQAAFDTALIRAQSILMRTDWLTWEQRTALCKQIAEIVK